MFDRLLFFGCWLFDFKADIVGVHDALDRIIHFGEAEVEVNLFPLVEISTPLIFFWVSFSSTPRPNVFSTSKGLFLFMVLSSFF